MKVYIVIEGTWRDYSGDHEEEYIDSVHSTPDKAIRRIQILANQSVNLLLENQLILMKILTVL